MRAEILDVVRGPGSLDQRAEEENLWGVRTVQTTQIASGTAIVMSIQAGAAVGWVRMGLTVEFRGAAVGR